MSRWRNIVAHRSLTDSGGRDLEEAEEVRLAVPAGADQSDARRLAFGVGQGIGGAGREAARDGGGEEGTTLHGTTPGGTEGRWNGG